VNATKIILTRCQIFHLKCTKFNFGWGSAPDPAGELTALPRPTSWIWEGEEKRKEEMGARKEERKGGKGEER